jgi:MacB-like periplasmic core domain
VAGWGGITASLNVGDSAELVSGSVVTGNFFDVLGAGPAARGRLISPSDDVTPGGHPVAVISYEFWQTRFAGEPAVVGREVRLNGQAFTVVGVTLSKGEGLSRDRERALC